jgi:hypothetical protein
VRCKCSTSEGSLAAGNGPGGAIFSWKTIMRGTPLRGAALADVVTTREVDDRGGDAEKSLVADF